MQEAHVDEVHLEWKVKNLVPNLWRWNVKICSDEFLVSSERFKMVILLNSGNVNDDTIGWMSVYFNKLYRTNKRHRISYTIGIRKRDGSTFKSFSKASEFGETVFSIGKSKFQRISELQALKNVLIHDDGFTLFCIARDCIALPVETVNIVETPPPTVVVKNEAPISTVKFRGTESSIQILQQNFKDLIVNGREEDVTFKIEDQALKAHKLILSARSPVFFAMFDHDTEEKRTGIVKIADFSAKAFKEFLYFIYTGDLDVVSSSNVVELYKAADKYDFKDLKNECTSYISVKLNSEIFCDVALLAELHNEPELMKTATGFFIKNCQTIITTSKWQLLMKEYTTVANGLLMKMMNKKQ